MSSLPFSDSEVFGPHSPDYSQPCPLILKGIPQPIRFSSIILLYSLLFPVFIVPRMRVSSPCANLNFPSMSMFPSQGNKAWRRRLSCQHSFCPHCVGIIPYEAEAAEAEHFLWAIYLPTRCRRCLIARVTILLHTECTTHEIVYGPRLCRLDPGSRSGSIQ